MNPSQQVDQLIAELTDWRGPTFAAVRKAVLAADPEIIEEFKWMGSPVWSRDGMIAVCDAHKKWVKITFAHGAFIPDPDKLFNNGFNGGTRRSIDYFEGVTVNAAGLEALVRAAIEFNQTNLKKNASKPGAARARPAGPAHSWQQGPAKAKQAPARVQARKRK